MEMLLASRPNWMWKTQISVAPKSPARTHQGICRPAGTSAGWFSVTRSRPVPTRSRTRIRATTRRVGRDTRRCVAPSRAWALLLIGEKIDTTGSHP